MSTKKNNNKLPASWKFNPDHFSEAHILPVDTIGTHKQYRMIQDNIYGYIHEVTQNMFDSNDSGCPNILEIHVFPPGSNPAIVFRDHGTEGITKDYHGDIHAFIEDSKATSNKPERGLRRKGIGMFQYTNIAPYVVITSMDKEMIHIVPLWETPEGATAFGGYFSKPILPKYIKEFRIDSPGTEVVFYNRPDTAQQIDVKQLVKSTRDRWSLRIFDEKLVQFYINTKIMTPHQWLLDHPPKPLGRMNSGHIIRGNIWGDEKGNGFIKCHQDGYLVETIPIEPRQATGYIECNDPALETDAGRNKFLKSNIAWSEFKLKVTRLLMQFPKIAVERQDEKNVLKVRDLALAVLDLPLGATARGRTPDYMKTEQTGDKHGEGTIGYPISPDPDPDREIIRRPPHERDDENQTTIGNEGEDTVKKHTDEEKGPRQKHPALNFLENRHYGADHPLFILDSGRKPPLLIENADNEEHPIYQNLKVKTFPGVFVRMYNCKLLDWLAEVNAEIHGVMNEEIRMFLSRERVKTWKQTGYYTIPNAAAEERELLNKE